MTIARVSFGWKFHQPVPHPKSNYGFPTELRTINFHDGCTIFKHNWIQRLLFLFAQLLIFNENLMVVVDSVNINESSSSSNSSVRAFSVSPAGNSVLNIREQGVQDPITQSLHLQESTRSNRELILHLPSKSASSLETSTKKPGGKSSSSGSFVAVQEDVPIQRIHNTDSIWTRKTRARSSSIIHNAEVESQFEALQSQVSSGSTPILHMHDRKLSKVQLEQIQEISLLTSKEQHHAISKRSGGYFNQDKNKVNEDYEKSLRLFWFLGGIAITFFILIFVSTLLCFCCPFCMMSKRTLRHRDESIDGSGVLYQSSTGGIETTNTGLRSSSIQISNISPTFQQHRMSQDLSGFSRSPRPSTSQQGARLSVSGHSGLSTARNSVF